MKKTILFAALGAWQLAAANQQKHQQKTTKDTTTKVWIQKKWMKVLVGFILQTLKMEIR